MKILPVLFTAALLDISLATTSTSAAEPSAQSDSPLPVRGLHLSAPSKRDVGLLIEFIRDALPREGVNTLILEFNYAYDYQRRKEFSDPESPGKAEVWAIAEACREKGIALIPQINCLGHQSWAKKNGRLLEKHPEFDETPGKYPENKDIYCRSYCPLHPEVHRVLFDLIDELVEACEAKAFHVGMDEVFLLADPDCPRCKGKDAAALFAGEVKKLHEHLKSRGCRMWMWGDRFLDGKATGLGEWEASINATYASVDAVPKDIVICDWHYDAAPGTARFFADKGFDVVACPWRKAPVALQQLEQMRALRASPDRDAARHGLGMVQTTWYGAASFIRAYQALEKSAEEPNGSAAESADCFRKMFRAIRER
jgi:hypothetical protein